MKHAVELIGGHRDEKGVLHVNENARGCPYCGTVEVKTYDAEGETRAAFYHAGAECCARRVTDQLAWREAEIDRIDKDLNARYDEIRKLREDASKALTKTEAARLNGLADKKDGNMKAVVEAFKEKASDLEEERTRLQKRRAWLQRQEAA